MQNYVYILAILVASCNTTGRNGASVAAAEESSFTGAQGITIAYQIRKVPDAKAAVMMLTGYTESYFYYDEMIQDLNNKKYDVYIMDNRGMGLSGRQVTNPQVVHVEKFKHYVDDAQKFYKTVVKPGANGKPIMLFAHSTGGLMGVGLLARCQDCFKAATLNAPLLQVNTGNIPWIIAYGTVNTAVLLGYGKDYAVGMKDTTDVANYKFEQNVTTHSVERFERQKEQMLAHPEIVQGGGSNQWIKESLDETDRVTQYAKDVKTPVLLFQAGEDVFVEKGGQDNFCSIAKSCKKVFFEHSRHEIMRETDDIRNPMMDAMFAHFDAHL